MSLATKLFALVFVVALQSSYAINLQLLGGIWICQTLPSVMLALYTPRRLHATGLLLGWLVGMVMGTCVYHIAHQRIGSKLGNIGRNVEIESFTQALYDARELAMSRMQDEAETLHAEGIVGVQLRQHSHTWGSHTTEFFAIGTAVRPLRADHIIERPTMVLSLDS